MTLLITLAAAVTATICWYIGNSKLNIGSLALMYWGASLMWLVDAVVEYLEIGAEYFKPMGLDMINDAYLGLSVVILGLIIWIAGVLLKDPKGKIKNMLCR